MAIMKNPMFPAFAAMMLPIAFWYTLMLYCAITGTY